MNVCFVLFSFYGGGIGRVTSILANELNGKNDIYCFAYGFTDADSYTYKPFKTFFPVDYAYHSKISMKNAILKQHYVKKLTSFAQDNEIDVIVTCGALFYPAAAMAAKACHAKLIFWEHTSPYVTTGYQFEKQARALGARFSDCNLLLTKQAQQIFNEKYPRNKNFQIYNPIDPELSRKKVDYKSECKTIISVGRLRYQKNFDRLVGIAAKVLENHPDWAWDIYGKGADEDALKALIHKYGMEEKIRLRGQVGDLYDRYNQYAFVVMTSRFEGFPMTLLEAAAKGLPMIAFDVLTGPSEIIKDGVNGYLCDSKSDADMIKKIEKLMADENLCKRMSLESRKTADEFNLYHISEQWVKLLQSLSR